MAGPVIIEQFQLSNTEFGFIGSAFLFAYAIGNVLLTVWGTLIVYLMS